MNAPAPKIDWADAEATLAVGLILGSSRKAAVEYLAAKLRLVREEGVGEGIRRVSAALSEPLLSNNDPYVP